MSSGHPPASCAGPTCKACGRASGHWPRCGALPRTTALDAAHRQWALVILVALALGLLHAHFGAYPGAARQRRNVSNPSCDHMRAFPLLATLRTGVMLRFDRLVLHLIGLAAAYRGVSMGTPPDSWLDTMSIGRSPSHFSFNNPLASSIAASWEYQLKTVLNLLCK
jgi:hypothetical protein